jgi:hypothetical protein
VPGFDSYTRMTGMRVASVDWVKTVKGMGGMEGRRCQPAMNQAMFWESSDQFPRLMSYCWLLAWQRWESRNKGHGQKASSSFSL